ncbi:NUDIX hydrolase [Sporomusa malonica]|uniref:NUDIX domain-containing protein n=1 Tax=Sporomusa malonica TaxID=112901 RepID=A0A1W2ELZ3_9FIRM|nr:CoA pyrophosphatase [Sporomusa malonica]SMD10737.1 NUDIX domain-containing protein [Sporomusa malonica]
MDADKIKNRLAAALHGRIAKIANADDYLQAAVTVPLVDIAGQPSVLFEVRSGKLQWQPGEICFPGGRIEADDISPLHAAVRETVEELGVQPENIEVLGPLDIMVSAIGVMLYPFAVQLTAQWPLAHNADEVAEVFTVPLEFLLNTKPQVAAMETATKPLTGFPFDLMPPDYPQGYRRRAKYPVLFYQYKHYVIWGLTARILDDFLNLCRERLGGDKEI